MSQLSTKFLKDLAVTTAKIAADAVTDAKIRLSNNGFLKARNAANNANVDIVKVNGSDRIEFASVPQVTADASASNDLVRYSQVLGFIEGSKPKTAVRVATTASGVLGSAFENGDSIDGITLATGNRILIKDQADVNASLILQDLTYSADALGSGGNAITIEYTTGGTAGSEVVSVLSNAISVQIESGVSTATQVKAAVDGFPAAASLVNVSISGTAGNAQTAPVGATNLAGGMAIFENGIYVVAASGAPSRASDYNNVSEIPGSYTVAQEGTANQGVLFVTTSSPATLEVDPIVFVARSVQTYTGGDMITLSGNAFSVDLHATSGLESSNPGNAAGELRIKLEASNPTIQIDGSNQLGVKLDAAGALVTGASGLKANLEASNPSLQISSNELGLKMDAAGALQKVAGGVQVKVDAATVKINGSNNLEGLKDREQEITLSGTDITNQYVDLAFPIYGTSASVNSLSLVPDGGIPQRKGVDYTVSLTGGAGGVTRVTFAGDLATAGAAELVATDVLVFSYSYLT